jgi:serine protease Do
VPFPIDPRSIDAANRGLFLCQDPAMRSRVLPLFSFDPAHPEKRPVGHGTAFRIDPWSRALTAFHVVEDLFEPSRNGSQFVLRPNFRLAALELSGMIIGHVPMPEGAWRPIAECHTELSVLQLPLQLPSLRNLSELAVLRLRPNKRRESGTPFLPLDLTCWRPRTGETVLALGFPNLDAERPESSDDRPIEQYLFGSFATITDVEQADTSRGRPWPQIRVTASWPGGMSGGPVFNSDGRVIGVVSAGFDGEGGASATYLSGWPMPQRLLRSIDPSNPGWFFCHAAFDDRGELVYSGQNRAEVERFASENGLTDLGAVSVMPLTGSFLRVPVDLDRTPSSTE